MSESVPNQEEVQKPVEAVDTVLAEAVEAVEDTREKYPWITIAEGLGFDGVLGIFENGKCALCQEGGNDKNDGIKTPTFVDRNDLRGMLTHLDDMHASLKV